MDGEDVGGVVDAEHVAGVKASDRFPSVVDRVDRADRAGLEVHRHVDRPRRPVEADRSKRRVVRKRGGRNDALAEKGKAVGMGWEGEGEEEGDDGARVARRACLGCESSDCGHTCQQ